MTREELEHAIRAACDLTDETEMIVFGSQAILGQHPDAPDELRQSAEADMAPKHAVAKVDLIDSVLGADSLFHRTHGFYVHGVPIETAVLPAGWERRAVKLQNANTRDYIGWCVEAHDLSASKLVAYREKDREFVRTLLQHQLVKAPKLRRRIGELPNDQADPQRRERLTTWLQQTLRELAETRR
ncbi:MAG: hypothetical protein HOQ11_02315 [Gemmatimonadaceae bacterium]|nr:hypothetical protein [Gemmatimonadaceae bacterium]NUQ92794.1 hypothetical protein [Gemmatimonadaceae bacterium]NUR18981.1 hypothetical protein [Gemmatimonadaceae bacterium]NUS96223.1 hypothetical protein [Gemmatimonadaceae bacterium]